MATKPQTLAPASRGLCIFGHGIRRGYGQIGDRVMGKTATTNSEWTRATN